MEGSRGGGPTEQKGLQGLEVRLGGNSSRNPDLLPNPNTFESLLTLEHNTVCWGAQSYCHVKGVGEQRVGAARCWQST